MIQLIEDFEAVSSPNYLKRIAKARKEKGGITLEELKRKYKIKKSIVDYEPHKPQ